MYVYIYIYSKLKIIYPEHSILEIIFDWQQEASASATIIINYYY